MSRREQREAKRAEKATARQNLVKWRDGWSNKRYKLSAPSTMKDLEARVAWVTAARQQCDDMVIWLNKQIALFDAREARNKSPKDS